MIQSPSKNPNSEHRAGNQPLNMWILGAISYPTHNSITSSTDLELRLQKWWLRLKADGVVKQRSAFHSIQPTGRRSQRKHFHKLLLSTLSLW